MISERLKLLQIYALCLDICTIIVSYGISLGFVYGFNGNIPELPQFRLIYIFIPVYMFSYYIADLYRYRDRLSIFKTLENIVTANGTAVFFMAVLSFFFRYGDQISRIVFALMLFTNIIFTFIIRLLSIVLINRTYKNRITVKTVILVIGRNKKNISEHIIQNVKLGYEIIDIIEKNIKRVESFDSDEVVNQISDMIKKGALDELILIADVKYFSVAEKMLIELENMGITVHLYIDIRIEGVYKKINQYGDLVMLSMYKSKLSAFQLFQKRILDIIGGLTGVVLAFFIGAVIGPLIVIESGFPILFTQIRVGENGRRFKLYKFRSMCIDAESKKKELMDINEIGGNMFKLSNDPRVTRVGKFIRKTSLDEFPQFLNVLLGDMSLVGTRPPTIEEVSNYDFHHIRRISIKPGITGMWQISGRSGIKDFEEVVRLDLQYIDNWSLWLDIKIIIKTVFVCIKRTGAR